MANPYETLGVSKSASPDEIRKAYRKLAKDTHPDLHPGDAEAERRFKEISAAHDILGDADKRKRFDAGEIDESGAERPERRYYRDYAEADPTMRYGAGTGFGGGEAFDPDDLFAHLFRNRAERDAPPRGRGGDVRYRLPVDFLDAVNGARRTVSMPDGKTLDIEIPAGFRDGQILRLKGQGLPGHGSEPAGDAYVEVEVLSHPTFRRDGFDMHSSLPVSLSEALNGGSVRAETVDGPVDVKVPRRAKTGTTLRLRGKGVRRDKAGARGDHLIALVVVPPDNPDDELAEFMAGWEARNPQDPRRAKGDRS